jgi:transcriptional regulator with XRE-family HTH domain
MPSPQGPLLPRRRLGAELRRLRGDRTLEEVAAETLISTSKLSRLENGQGVPQPRDIRDLIDFYRADRFTSDRLRRWMNDGRRQAWWKEYSDVMSESFDVFLDYESGASIIRTYTSMIVPGLLQTEAYAARLIRTLSPQHTADQVDRQVRLRLRRQSILFDDEDDAIRLLAVIDEAALHRILFIGADDDARGQLEHLHQLSL